MGEFERNYYLKCQELAELVENDQQEIINEMVNNKAVELRLKLESIEEQFAELCLNAEKSQQNPDMMKKDPDISKEQALPVQIYVSGLKPEITEASLRDYFQRWGAISDIFIPMDELQGRHRGFCYITFANLINKHPCDEKDPHILNGHKLYVDNNEFSSTSEEKTSVLMVNGAIQSIPTENLDVYFSQYGNVIDIIRKKNPKKQLFLRFAFVKFNSTLAVDNATKLNHQLINGVLVHVRKAKNFESNGVIDDVVAEASPPTLIFDENMLFKYRVLPLDETITLDVLKQYFNKYGHVVDSYIPKEYGSKEKKLYGYVIMCISKDSPTLRSRHHVINGKNICIELDIPSKYANKSKCIIVSASPKIIEKISEVQLKSFFKKFGKVVEVRKPLDTRSKTTTHYAFVEFQTEDVVEEVIKRPVYVINNLPFGVAKARMNPR